MLHNFAANLFGKLRGKFYQDCLSFTEDITENILVSFSPETVYITENDGTLTTVSITQIFL